MGNIYWAGVFPGIVFGTFVSIGVWRTLPHTVAAMRHVLWLIPGLHFAGAFLAGPAVALVYGLVVVPALGGLAPLVWPLAVTILELPAAWLVWQTGSQARVLIVSISIGSVVALGWLLPLVYALAVG